MIPARLPVWRRAALASASAAIAGLVAVAAEPVLANPAADARDCMELMDQGGLDACTRVIASGALDASNQAAALYHRGQKRRFRGQLDEAREDFDAALALDAENLEFLRARGGLLAEIGDHSAALADFDAALTLDADDAAALAGRGHANGLAGDLDAAIDDYSRALTLDPSLDLAVENRALAQNARAWARWIGGDAESALGDAEAAAQVLQGSASVQDTLAHVLASLGRADEALAAFEAAIQFSGGDAVTAYQDALARKGYEIGPERGAYNEATRAALIACIRDDCRLLGR